MKEEIILNVNNPHHLEKLYRENKSSFKKAFNLAYPDIQQSTVAQVWRERLNFEGEEISWGTRHELTFIVVISLIAGLIAKIPQFASIEPEYFYPRNIAFIVFPALTAYFIWKQKLSAKRIMIVVITILIAAFYINSLPDGDKSDTVILACIHLPLFLWALLGSTFVGENLHDQSRRLDFLRFNGDLVVMTALILIAGGILSGVTIGLFELIDLRIEEFYFENVAVWGLAAAPIVGTFLVRTNPQLVNKVSPVIAKVFTPLVLVMLVVYLGAIMVTGKDPYNDREFLIIFNILLIGVMAIIFFSVAEITKNANTKIGVIVLLALSIVTIIINGIALSAILFRISEWGLTPNRLAVLGGNILMLTNLFMISYRLLNATRDGNEIERVEKSIAAYLPIYAMWTTFVTFVFPVLFGFK